MNLILTTTFAITLGAFILIWLIHVWLRDAGIVDYYWGPGFAVIGWASVALGPGPARPAALVFLAAVTVWAARLAGQLIARHVASDGEDPRYAAMRANGGPHYWWQSLYKVFLLQAVILWITAAPVHAVALAGAGDTSWLSFVGYALFAAGLGLESLADAELARFRRKDADKALLDSGLWAFSRHPNYLGELVLWYGLALVAYDLTGAAVVLAGPLLLTLVIRGVSLPLTERHLLATREAYAGYRERVPALVPFTQPARPDSAGAARPPAK